MKTETVHMDTLRPGDTVMLGGRMHTLSRLNLKRCPFVGATVYGDCRAPQGRMIDVVLFPKWHKGHLVRHVRQP